MLVRAIGGAALAAVLACSGLGLCWREVTLPKHDCCKEEGPTSTLVKPCASPVAHENKVELAPPLTAVKIVTLDQTIEACAARHPAVSSSSPTARHIILRI